MLRCLLFFQNREILRAESCQDVRVSCLEAYDLRVLAGDEQKHELI